MPSNILNYRDYNQVAENGREFPRSDIWEVKFLRRPAGVYVPSDTVINLRTNEVDLGIPGDMSMIEQEVKGFTIHQAGIVKTNGVLSLTSIDREDFSLSFLKESWMQSMSTRRNHASGRKIDYSAEMQFILYNTNRVPIKEFVFYNLVLQDNEQAGETGFSSTSADSIGAITIAMAYEYFDRKTLTVPGIGSTISNAL